jgi:UDP-N-acetylmuramate: L-alanyl-gamma-D-glutamyl-meso-diaminopimelate ligase
VFEPRSFTARSAVFQDELAEALARADAVVVAKVMRSSRLAAADELSEERLVADLTAAGTPASFVANPDEIVTFLSSEVRAGDVVLVMSNGAFGGLHQKLLAALGRSS